MDDGLSSLQETLTEDMPSIHEAIESDESFSSFSDLEEESDGHEKRDAKSTELPPPPREDSGSNDGEREPTSDDGTPLKKSPVSQKKPVPAIAEVLAEGVGGGKEGKSLVGYSDVSSEEFSEPEAGEITDSPGTCSPEHRKEPRIYAPPPRRLPPPVHRSPPTSSYPQRNQLSRASPIHSPVASPYLPRPATPAGLPSSDGEALEGPPDPSEGGIPPHSLVPYSTNMSPDRRRHDVGSGEYYRGPHPIVDGDRDARARKKDHRDKKHKKREKKRKRAERSYSPPVHKKRKKKKYKSRNGSPEFDESIDEDSNVSSDNEVMEVQVERRYGSAHERRGGPEDPDGGREQSPESSEIEDIASPRRDPDCPREPGPEFRSVTAGHPRRRRERENQRRTPPHPPPPSHSPSRHRRRTPPPQGRSGRSLPQSPRRPNSPPMQKRPPSPSPSRRQSAISPRKVVPLHRSHSPSISSKRSHSPQHYMEIGGHESPHYRHYPQQQTRKEKRRKKKEKDREYHQHCRRTSRSKSRSASRSRSRGKSPRYVL